MTLIAGALFGTGLTTAGQFAVASQLNADPIGSVFPFASLGDVTPLYIGLGLAVVAAAFEFGERIERDRLKLRRDTARLQRDVDGLV